MNINPISVYKNVISGGSRSFLGQSQVAVNKSEVDKIADITPDYGVKAPISYRFDGEIKLPNDLTAHCYKLANGQRVVIVPKDGATVVKTYVNTGSFNEPDNLRGISHYIEHNLFNGSEDLGDKVFFDEVNKMGAFTNASTSFSVTDYYISSQLLDDGDLENEIQLHAGMLQSPKFLEEKLEKEKNIVDSEINRCLSDESSRAESITLKNLFNIKSSSPDLVAGSTDNIDALTREDVVNYFNNNYYPANMVTVITGEVEPNEAISLVSKYFTSTKQAQNRHYEKMTPITEPIRQDIISNKKEGAAEIYLGFAGPENSNLKDKIYLRAVGYLFTGLANSRVKNIEKNYSTSIDITTERLGTRTSDKTAKIISASVSEDNVEPLLKELYSVIQSLGTNPPTPDEFEAIKNQIKKSNSTFMQSSSALNHHLGMNFLNGTPDALTNYDLTLDNMTYQDFVETAKKYFDLNKVALTVVHPSGTDENSVKNNYNATKVGEISFTGLNKKVPLDLKKVTEYKMSNNFSIVLQDEDSDVVNYSFLLDTNVYTPQKAAVVDVLNDMLQNGTMYKPKDTIDALYDKYGIDVGLYAGSDALILSGDFPTNNATQSLDILREKIQAPELSKELFDSAIKRCSVNYLTNEPSAYEKFNKEIFKNTELSATTEEKLESLSQITFEDVKQAYNNIFANAQGRVVVTGPFSKHPELKQEVFRHVASFNPVKHKDVNLFNSFEPIKETKVHTVETKRNQAEVIEGFKFKQNGNIKDNLCFSLLNTILGDGPSSRLFNDLREQRHLCYAVSSEYLTVNDIGVFSLNIETTTNNAETGKNSYDNIQKSIKGFNENIKKITTEKVSEDELNRAKKTIKSEILSNFEMNDDKNAVLLAGVGSAYGVNFINQELELIDKITPDDILNAAKYVFSSEPIYSISATKDALNANEKYLNSLTSHNQ
ncbi:insulinase family protein [bacterium]|nr:insulinase family protein [bacterium]